MTRVVALVLVRLEVQLQIGRTGKGARAVRTPVLLLAVVRHPVLRQLGNK